MPSSAPNLNILDDKTRVASRAIPRAGAPEILRARSPGVWPHPLPALPWLCPCRGRGRGPWDRPHLWYLMRDAMSGVTAPRHGGTATLRRRYLIHALHGVEGGAAARTEWPVIDLMGIAAPRGARR